MKKVAFGALMLTTIVLASCNKNKCAECHYEVGESQVEIGTYCGDDLEDIEANGHSDGTTTHEVHCGEH